MNKNVWLLFACQALMNAVMSGQTVMASLVGYKLSGTALNTLADGDPDDRGHERIARRGICVSPVRPARRFLAGLRHHDDAAA